jgi:hypothetical protein
VIKRLPPEGMLVVEFEDFGRDIFMHWINQWKEALSRI